MDMKTFNTNDAKNIVNSHYNDELHNVLIDIKNNAEKCETVLHVYKPLSSSTINELKKRGFRIFNHPSIAIQKDNLYYSIYWD